MVIKREKSQLLFLLIVVLFIPAFIHMYIGFSGGLSAVALKIHFYALPVSALFLLFAYGLIRSINRRIVISETGLLVEEFSSFEFPWSTLRRATTKSQLLPRGGACLWLVLDTRNDAAFANITVSKLNKLIGINGIPVCNLANYEGDADDIVSIINSRAVP
ncbi:hypothetical protein QFX18_03555 [Saccharophagus degradans]|uniref:hypothetical protein n=1 Tax=Saccharophagus degradans TaxID=86304 RepID=UPI002477E01E|nr:hypothetical protein [Saccharophagus degradans]WGO99136.1 hypothetical protein QFX18_03555 [Saccharophagus degradans]